MKKILLYSKNITFSILFIIALCLSLAIFVLINNGFTLNDLIFYISIVFAITILVLSLFLIKSCYMIIDTEKEEIFIKVFNWNEKRKYKFEEIDSVVIEDYSYRRHKLLRGVFVFKDKNLSKYQSISYVSLSSKTVNKKVREICQFINAELKNSLFSKK